MKRNVIQKIDILTACLLLNSQITGSLRELGTAIGEIHVNNFTSEPGWSGG
jgi:hypothetical protein